LEYSQKKPVGEQACFVTIIAVLNEDNQFTFRSGQLFYFLFINEFS